MLYFVITTIQNPTASVLGLVEKLNEVGGKLIVAGDKKGTVDFHPPSAESQHSKFIITQPLADGVFEFSGSGINS